MRLALLLLCAVTAAGADTWSYWVQPCGDEAARETGCRGGDPELARWALAEWTRAAPALRFTPASEQQARLRIYWASGRGGLYGETRTLEVNGQPRAAIYVLPDTRMLGPSIAAACANDTLLREAIVYLTCLHESGHALGLRHTAEFGDIMYSFQFGGDVDEYFGRYRRRLKDRATIPAATGLSAADRAALRLLFP